MGPGAAELTLMVQQTPPCLGDLAAWRHRGGTVDKAGGRRLAPDEVAESTFSEKGPNWPDAQVCRFVRRFNRWPIQQSEAWDSRAMPSGQYDGSTARIREMTAVSPSAVAAAVSTRRLTWPSSPCCFTPCCTSAARRNGQQTCNLTGYQTGHPVRTFSAAIAGDPVDIPGGV